MAFSTSEAGFQRSSIASAGAVVAALVFAPADVLAHEVKAAAATSLSSSDAALLTKQRLGIPVKEIERGNAYAPVVWMPAGGSVKLAGSDLSFGLARLNPLVRRSVGLSSSDVGAVAAPVMAVQVSPNTSLTVIKIMGDSSGAMLAWQFKL